MAFSRLQRGAEPARPEVPDLRVGRPRCGYAALMLVLAVASSCSGPPSGEESSQLPTLPRLEGLAWENRIDRAWIAGCGTGADLWKWRDSTTVKCDAYGTYLIGTHGTFDWEVYFTGPEIDRLVVEGNDLDRVELELWWEPPEGVLEIGVPSLVT